VFSPDGAGLRIEVNQFLKWVVVVVALEPLWVSVLSRNAPLMLDTAVPPAVGP
jgi:hypothetical protein